MQINIFLDFHFGTLQSHIFDSTTLKIQRKEGKENNEMMLFYNVIMI